MPKIHLWPSMEDLTSGISHQLRGRLEAFPAVVSINKYAAALTEILTENGVRDFCYPRGDRTAKKS